MNGHARSLTAAVLLGALSTWGVTRSYAQRPVDPQGQQMVNAFTTWVAANNIPNASLAVMRGDDVIGEWSHGSLSPNAAQPVASLSKAITGACIVKFAQDSRLNFWDSIGLRNPDYWGTSIAPIQISELLTHQSGLTSDPTQNAALLATLDFTKPNLTEQLNPIQNDPLGAKTYNYNNTNYVALGLMVERTGFGDYETACKSEVLDPMGVTTAALNPELRILSSYGGWKISPFDYLRFLNVFRGSKNFFNRAMVWPTAQFANGSSYGPGVWMTPNGNDFIYSHAGAFSFTKGPDSWNFGAYFSMFGEGVRYIATYSPQPTNSAAVTNLDAAMSAVANTPPPAPAPSTSH